MPTARAYRPRRSVLYLPASNARAVAKAATLPCDAVVLDLEDAVAPGAKEAAREAARSAVAGGGYGEREVAVRVNGIDTSWHADDLAALAAAGPDAIVVPKVGSAQDVRAVVEALDAGGAPSGTSVWAMIETPAAVLRAPEIAAASPRLGALVLGTNDLADQLRAEHVPGRAPLVAALGWCVLAARAAGIVILDGVHNDVGGGPEFRAECEQGRAMGFDGKTLIHPGQIDAANATFAPDEAALEDARGVVAAWEDAGAEGVATFEGRMIEAMHVETARRLLETDAAIRGAAGSDGFDAEERSDTTDRAVESD